MLRYARGELYESLYYGDGAVSRELMSYIIRHYIHKAYAVKSNVTTKGGHSHFLCPECGCELRVTELGIYYCTKCPWNQLKLFNLEIDEMYFTGYLGGGGGGSGYLPDDPNPDQPDPNTGGSGGGGASGDGGGTDIPPGIILDTIAQQRIAPALRLILEDCAGASLINYISEYEVVFREKAGMMSLAEMTAIRVNERDTNTQEIIGYHYKYKIDYNLSSPPPSEIPIYVLFEELFHCLQHTSYGDFPKDWKMNVEVEAKYATFLFMDRQGCLEEFLSTDAEKRCFNDYRSAPTPDNYSRLVNYVRDLAPAYKNMPEDSTHRSMPNTFIFNCYD